MIAHYYYFVASLPTLKPDEAPRMSSIRHLELCGRYLTSEHLAQLRNAVWDRLAPKSDNRTIAQWQAFEIGLRNQLAILRARVRGEDVLPHLREVPRPTVVIPRVRAAFDAGDPLSVERRLFEIRWRFLGWLDREHFMSLDSLIIYRIKLQLLERRASMNRDAGNEALHDVRAGAERIGKRVLAEVTG